MDDAEEILGLVSQPLSVSKNHNEVAGQYLVQENSYTKYLFTTILVGSGLALSASAKLFFEADNGSMEQNISLFSLWFFFLSLCSVFLSGVLYVTSLECKKNSQLSLSRWQSGSVGTKKMTVQILENKNFSEIDDEHFRGLLIQHLTVKLEKIEGSIQRKSSQKFERQASFAIACSMVLFALGIFLPLIVLTIDMLL